METVDIPHALEGGCLCGALRYRVEAGEANSAYCHCRMCQRAGGAPVMAWFTVPAQRFSFVRGAPTRYRSSPQAVREFCGNCGAPILFRPDGDLRVDISSATLDEPDLMPPRYHIWRMSRVGWFETADALPRFAGQGPDV